MPLIKQLRAEELSLQKIAARLNEQGHVTRRGKKFFAAQVKAVLDRAREQ